MVEQRPDGPGAGVSPPALGGARCNCAGNWRSKEEAFHLVLAGVVGVIGGLVNLFFYYAVHFVQPGDPVEVAERLLNWERVLLTTLGGLTAGLVLHWGLRFVGPQGSTNLLEVVVAGDGRLPFRTEFVKTISAIVSIATGASIGREGGITQLAATLSSKLGQFAKWPPYRLRLLVGAARPPASRRPTTRQSPARSFRRSSCSAIFR